MVAPDGSDVDAAGRRPDGRCAAARDEHGVDPRALEREHLVARRDVDARDRELARRARPGSSSSTASSGSASLVVVVARSSRKISGSSCSSASSSSSSSRTSTTGSRCVVRVTRPRGGGRSRRRRPASPPPIQSSGSVVASRMPSIARLTASAFAPWASAVSRGARVVDAGDDGDPVPFGDALAEASRDPGTCSNASRGLGGRTSAEASSRSSPAQS